jgi:hypothetical protein
MLSQIRCRHIALKVDSNFLESGQKLLGAVGLMIFMYAEMGHGRLQEVGRFLRYQN